MSLPSLKAGARRVNQTQGMQSEHPLFRRFENKLELSSELSIEWTMRGRDFFFRPVQSDLSLLCCQLERRSVPPTMLQCAVRRRQLQKRLLKNLSSRNFWRFWPLDEKRELVFNLDFALIRHTDADFWLRLNWLHPCDEPAFKARLRGSAASRAVYIRSVKAVPGAT